MHCGIQGFPYLANGVGHPDSLHIQKVHMLCLRKQVISQLFIEIARNYPPRHLQGRIPDAHSVGKLLWKGPTGKPLSVPTDL